ncbi:MAG: hypothetical protein KJP23_07565, partial [Deltaproteobacteria bacterium]|nr:hypothetical protein [Deltaproteobacteria bacterium]
MEKGIIAAPAKVSGSGSLFRNERGLSSQELKYFLLYWDRVFIPTTNIMHLSLPDEDEMISTGIISRPRVTFSGSFNGETIAAAQLLAQTTIAKQLIENDKNIDWVVHQIGNEIILPSNEIIKQQAIRVDLINTLPVPDESVAIPDIIEFKERRNDELKQLHQALDDFYLEILASPDPGLKAKAVVSNLTNAISDLQNSASERWRITTKFDISAEINVHVKDILSAVAAGAVFDFYN